MIPVASSNLRAVDYNYSNGTLTILFRNGRTYEYYNVPQHIFEGLLSAPSKGRYHHRYIKPYPYHRINWILKNLKSILS